MQTHVCLQIATKVLTGSMFSGAIMYSETLRHVTLAVCLNEVSHETISYISGIGANGAKLKLFRKVRWDVITKHRSVNLSSTAKSLSYCLLLLMATELCQDIILSFCLTNTTANDINQLTGMHFKTENDAVARCIILS